MYGTPPLLVASVTVGDVEQRGKVLTVLTPIRSDATPHNGQATSATSSSANPSVPTTLPSPPSCSIRSVTTNETEELRKTRKEMENKQTPKRYVSA